MSILSKLPKKIKFLIKYVLFFINRIYGSILIVLNIPLAFIIILFSPFFKIRVGELEMRAIGHCSISIEIFLAELECDIHKKKNINHIWFVNDGYFPFEKKKISNKFLYKKWCEKLTIGPRFIFEPLFYIFRFLRNINLGNQFLIPYRHWRDHKDKSPWNIVDIHNVLPRTEAQIRFTEEEEKTGQEYLDKHDLKKDEYITFFARTNEYRIDGQASLRNSDVFKMIYGLKKVCKEKKLKAVRIGYSPENKLNPKDIDIIDYSNSKEKSDFLDIYISFNCKFMVGGPSGGSLMQFLNRKKLLSINHGDLGEISNLTYSLIPFVLPKKFKRVKTNKYISYSEAFKDKEKISVEYYSSKSTEIMFVNNSELEIYYAIYEMNNYIDQITFNKENDLQNYFWEIFEKKLGYKPNNDLVKISPYFLRENKDLLN